MSMTLFSPTSLANVLIYKGGITIPGDFPTLAAVQAGWTYTVLANVTDSDGTKTHTGQSFLLGDEIIWNGTNWTNVGPVMSGYVPFTGAPTDVDLGTHNLTTTGYVDTNVLKTQIIKYGSDTRYLTLGFNGGGYSEIKPVGDYLYLTGGDGDAGSSDNGYGFVLQGGNSPVISAGDGGNIIIQGGTGGVLGGANGQVQIATPFTINNAGTTVFTGASNVDLSGVTITSDSDIITSGDLTAGSAQINGITTLSSGGTDLILDPNNPTYFGGSYPLISSSMGYTIIEGGVICHDGPAYQGFIFLINYAETVQYTWSIEPTDSNNLVLLGTNAFRNVLRVMIDPSNTLVDDTTSALQVNGASKFTGGSVGGDTQTVETVVIPFTNYSAESIVWKSDTAVPTQAGLMWDMVWTGVDFAMRHYVGVDGNGSLNLTSNYDTPLSVAGQIVGNAHDITITPFDAVFGNSVTIGRDNVLTALFFKGVASISHDSTTSPNDNFFFTCTDAFTNSDGSAGQTPDYRDLREAVGYLTAGSGPVGGLYHGIENNGMSSLTNTFATFQTIRHDAPQFNWWLLSDGIQVNGQLGQELVNVGSGNGGFYTTVVWTMGAGWGDDGIWSNHGGFYYGNLAYKYATGGGATPATGTFTVNNADPALATRITVHYRDQTTRYHKNWWANYSGANISLAGASATHVYAVTGFTHVSPYIGYLTVTHTSGVAAWANGEAVTVAPTVVTNLTQDVGATGLCLVRHEMTGYSAGTLTMNLGGTIGRNIVANGVYSDTITAVGTSITYTPTAITDKYEITSISVRTIANRKDIYAHDGLFSGRGQFADGIYDSNVPNAVLSVEPTSRNLRKTDGNISIYWDTNAGAYGNENQPSIGFGLRILQSSGGVVRADWGTDFTVGNNNIAGGGYNKGIIRFVSDGSTTKLTTIQAGTQAGDITYTLPITAPAANGLPLISTTAGVLSWGTPLRKTRRVTITTDTVLATDETVFYNTTAACAVALPAGVAGTHYVLINSGSYNVVVTPNGTEKFNGSASQTLYAGEVFDMTYSSGDAGWWA